jgi:hypothetical protein
MRVEDDAGVLYSFRFARELSYDIGIHRVLLVDHTDGEVILVPTVLLHEPRVHSDVVS